MRLLRGLSERRALRREFAQAERQMQMLTNAEPVRNTLPWDIVLGAFVGGILTALGALAIMVWG